MTLDVYTRLQDAALSAMDRADFRPAKRPTVGNADAWVLAHIDPATYIRLGTATFDSYIHDIVDSISISEDVPGLQDPASADFEIVCQVLKSNRTCARLLLSTGDYQNIPTCPWAGMTAPQVGNAFRIYIGLYVASREGGYFKMKPWICHVFKDVAFRVAKALNPDTRFRRPRQVKTLEEALKPPQKPKAPAVPKRAQKHSHNAAARNPTTILRDTTNTTASSDPELGGKKKKTKKALRTYPYARNDVNKSHAPATTPLSINNAGSLSSIHNSPSSETSIKL
ncbi:hypothetical protein B0H16DRAFT_1881679 [Mycena metata]|uniref:Uncharacterized protein n=1 Tax=Mycena metata TaxID=1033252 RepID=A0AAD7JSN1_9AGAR|nr:hypothetical protein B0H16DRAFT_1881679 [Mycena metata]